MNSSSSSDDDVASPQKRMFPDIDEDVVPPHKRAKYSNKAPLHQLAKLSDKEESSDDDNSSNSENCNEDKDDFDPESEDVEATHEDQSQSTGKSFQSGLYSSIASRLMSKMGYIPGKGLGKKEDGIVDPVQASTQKGRRGLGIEPSVLGEVPKDFRWKPDDDDLKPETREKVLWMPSPPSETLSIDLLEDWLKKGVKKLILDDEDDFVSPEILQGVLQAKTCFDELHEEDLRNARFRSNPYETIGASIFLNRAAMKMANMDYVFNYMFTNYKQRQDSLTPCDGILYFADVCAGPGGFSEYVLFRRGWTAKGFGFTLKSSNDFKLSDFYAGTPETFNPYYGVAEDGNVYNPENLVALKQQVLENTDDKGVHFLMADGGFSTKGQENIQEILSKQLYLCQCLAALMLVRTGGHFVVKLFDIFTPFSVGLIYIMYRCFDKVCIHKPVTSRPANSERYLVCKRKKVGTESAEQHLFNVNMFLWRERESGRDVTQLVPLSVIKEDELFFKYICDSNDLIGENQIKNLLKIAKYCEDKNLKNPYQNDVKKECLELWNIPTGRARTKPVKLNYEEALVNIMGMLKIKPPDAHDLQSFKNNVIGKQPVPLKSAGDLKLFESVYDWYFMFLESKEDKEGSDLMVILATGTKQVARWNGRRWEPLQLNFVIPANTLLYGELVRELTIQDKTSVYKKVFHVIDALILGGRDISYLPLYIRRRQCELFCTALHKPFMDNTEEITLIRCKRLLNMENFSNEILNLEVRPTKRVREAVTIKIRTNNYRQEIYLIVGSILFMKEIKDPWQAKMSTSRNMKYYYNKETQQPTVFELTDKKIMDTFNTYISRVKWNWADAGVAILKKVSNKGLTLTEIENYIEQKKS